MNEKLPIVILIISLIGVLIHDSIDYKQYKDLTKTGEYSNVFSVYNSTTDNYDYFFKTANNKTIVVSKSFNNKKFPSQDKFLSSARVIYDPNNPEKFKYFPYRNSWKAVFKKVFFLGIVLSVFVSALGALKLFSKRTTKFDNWEKYKNTDKKYKKFKWAIKKHPVFNFFILNRLIILFYVFSFCLIFISFGFSSFNITAVLILTIFLLFILLSLLFGSKYVLLNEEKIEIHFWFLPQRSKTIEFRDLKAIDLKREKGNGLSVSFSFLNKEKKMRLALPFSNSEIKDFYAMISELNKNQTSL